MKEVSIVGVDLAKRVFQVHGAAADGSVICQSASNRDPRSASKRDPLVGMAYIDEEASDNRPAGGAGRA